MESMDQIIKKSPHIPSSPYKVYKDKWKNWGDWLGHYRVAEQNKRYLSFEDAKLFVKKFNINSREEWRAYTKTAPQDIFNKIPKTPDLIYKNKGWKGYKDFFGWNDKKMRYLSYKEAKTIVKTYNIKSAKEWYAFCKGELNSEFKKPDNIPVIVDRVYKKTGDWVSFPDFLGYGDKK